MKKIFSKDKKNRYKTKNIELHSFILKQIHNNSNFTKPIVWNSFNKQACLSSKESKTHISNRCVKTINRKTFNKFSNFSRSVFLKLVKSGKISSIKKSSW